MSIARARRCAASARHCNRASPANSNARRPEREVGRAPGAPLSPLHPVGIGLLGCGTVGGGVVKLLRRNGSMLEQKLGAPLKIVGIADRSLKPDPDLGISAALITRDSAALV